MERKMEVLGDDGTAFEAPDLEFHQIDKRLIKLEEVTNFLS